ncbi:DUF2141 domain-containing protein [Lacihabitans sp. LS3-19]|uniref:DUF2141 domain-containing protein n=1 Tax=Lacihabitans sp. LS3-19 TaxID=2487335 RepID=UPI001D5782D1|nr:DUF2141 domain-containing protein [Lacihabitans sp. LS3-19]MCB0536417.1 DUF2141 domain-containing protein [Bacteroidota bacterium]MCP9769743.1 DUF2141 domain-containing protein [Lacihabitans sp. LS3-19]
MKTAIIKLIAFALTLTLYSFVNLNAHTYSLTIKVNNLRNSKGVVQFALYNQDGSIPDEDYENYYKILKEEIVNGSSTITFKNSPSGKYAVNILHDENKNGKIDKGFILPIEGIGFSNFQSIGLTNRPNFSKASFELKENKSISVKVIYM